MGLFKSSKKSSSKSLDKAAVTAPPPPETVVPSEPEVVVNETSIVDSAAAFFNAAPVGYEIPEYQPRPPPNGGKFVSPLSSWLEEYGTGPFLSKDGAKPQYPGKKEKEEKEKESTDAETSSLVDIPTSGTDADENPRADETPRAEENPRKKPSHSKDKEGKDGSEPSEFTKVKRSSGRNSSSRHDAYDMPERSTRGSRDGSRSEGRSDERQSNRDDRHSNREDRYSRCDERFSRPDRTDERLSSKGRQGSRTSDSSYASDKSNGTDRSQGAEKASRDKDVPIDKEASTDKEASKGKEVPQEKEASKNKDTSRSKDVAKEKASKKSSRTKEVQREKAADLNSADFEEDKPAEPLSAKSVDDAANPTDSKPFDGSHSPVLDMDVEADLLLDPVHNDADSLGSPVDVKPQLEEIELELDGGGDGEGKKIRALDTGSDAADANKYMSDEQDLPDKDSEMTLLKDKLRQLQQKLAEERAEKLELQKKLKDRDREIYSLSKQLDKLEAQAERFERFERFGGADGNSSGSRNSLLEQDMVPLSERDMRSADDLQVALKAFKEHSNAKLQETFKQNADLRHQVESYETLCRTIGEVLRDYEWLQQCRIVTGELDYSRLRKAMMKLWHTGKTRAVLPVVAMVLAFGPDEVSRCRHVLNSAKQDADMVDYIPEIIEHNMDETMKRDAITVYIEAHKQLTEDTEIALYLTDRFAERYKGEWHCVVGEQYALSSCYESKVIKFKSGHRSVILWSN